MTTTKRCSQCGKQRPAQQVRPPKAADSHHGVCTHCQPSTESLRSLLP